MTDYSDLVPADLKESLSDGVNLKPSITTDQYTGGTPTNANQVKKSICYTDGTLKESICTANGLKASVLKANGGTDDFRIVSTTTVDAIASTISSGDITTTAGKMYTAELVLAVNATSTLRVQVNDDGVTTNYVQGNDVLNTETNDNAIAVINTGGTMIMQADFGVFGSKARFNFRNGYSAGNTDRTRSPYVMYATGNIVKFAVASSAESIIVGSKLVIKEWNFTPVIDVTADEDVQNLSTGTYSFASDKRYFTLWEGEVIAADDLDVFANNEQTDTNYINGYVDSAGGAGNELSNNPDVSCDANDFFRISGYLAIESGAPVMALFFGKDKSPRLTISGSSIDSESTLTRVDLKTGTADNIRSGARVRVWEMPTDNDLSTTKVEGSPAATISTGTIAPETGVLYQFLLVAKHDGAGSQYWRAYFNGNQTNTDYAKAQYRSGGTATGNDTFIGRASGTYGKHTMAYGMFAIFNNVPIIWIHHHGTYGFATGIVAHGCQYGIADTTLTEFRFTSITDDFAVDSKLDAWRNGNA